MADLVRLATPRRRRRGLPVVDDGQTRMPLRVLDYPERPPVFALRFQRLLLAAHAAQEVGCDGVALLVAVSVVEDQLRYRKAPAFWNGHLQEQLGLPYKSLAAARARCVQHGWLHYEPGGKGRPGYYWVCVPPAFELAEDTEQRFPSKNAHQTGNQREGEREAERRDNGQTFCPIPKPESSTPTLPDRGVAVARIRVEDKLKQAGVALIVETLDTALAQGLSLDAVEAVVDFYRSRPAAWGPGALRVRLISRSAVRHAPHEGWPPASPAEREQLQQQQRSADAVADRAARQADAVRRDELRQLELQFGPQIDELPESELIAILQEPHFLPEIRKRGSKSGMLRPLLLRAFAARYGSN